MRRGSVFGGAFLLAGSCIGAGMLALPVITGLAGFMPSLLMLIFAWLFMLVGGWYLLEVNLTLGYQYSLISLTELTLGKKCRWIVWVLFCFLFYCLNIAYVSASGQIISSFFQQLGIAVSYDIAAIIFALVFGIIVFIGTKAVDFCNRILMVGLIISYVILVFLGARYMDKHLLMVSNFNYALPAIPILVISFGFQNMIPSLAHYLAGDKKRLKQTILLGSFIPLCVYVIWELILLGIIPLAGREQLIHAVDQGKAVSSVLQEIIGVSFLTQITQVFALFAIVTSYIAQALSLVDFLSDGLRIIALGRARFFLVLLVICPPLFLAILKPGLFIRALNLAGGFAAVLLFGLIPPIMVWILRYIKQKKSVMFVGGGKPLLMLMMLLSCLIVICQFYFQFKG